MVSKKARRPNPEQGRARRVGQTANKGPPRAGASAANGKPPARRPASAGQRRVPRARPVRRRRRRVLPYLILLIFVLAAGIALSMNAFFQIEDIAVIGSERYNEDQIIEVSGIAPGDNLLRLSSGQISQDIIYAFPYIATVNMRRRFPPRVEIIVTEHLPEMAVYENGELALITLQGKLLERGNRTSPAGLPVIRGLRLEGHQPGQMLGGAHDPYNHERLVMLRYLFDAAYRVDFFPITHVDVSDRLNMRIVHEDRLVLELGSEADLEYKLTFLRHVIENKVEPDAQARLDISNARERRLVRRDGRVVDGRFIPGEIFVPGDLIIPEGSADDAEYESPQE